MLNKIYNRIRMFFSYLMQGLNSGDKLLTGTKDDVLSSGINNIQTINQNTLWDNLLKGEITDEVKELRHMTYAVNKESKNYKYIGNGIAIKKNNFGEIHSLIDENDGLPVKIIQNNYLIPETILDTLEHVDNKGYKPDRYNLNIKWDFTPRFRLEKYVNKVVIKLKNDNNVQIDLYVSQYPVKYDNIHKVFINEVNRIYNEVNNNYNNYKHFDILLFSELNFVTSKAYGSDDDLYYSYNNIKFKSIEMFDGHFIFKFDGTTQIDGLDLTNKFFDENQDKKYQNREIKCGLMLNLNEKDESNINHEEAKSLKNKLINNKKA